MTSPTILIQASSRSWSGAPDWCMNRVDGRPVTALCIESALNKFPEADIRIIAPEFDRGGELDGIPSLFPDNRISIFYGHDQSPLDRMINATEDMDEDELVLRVDGLHFSWLPEHAGNMLKLAGSEKLDCVKMPDDFPIQLTADVYRIAALKRAASILEERNNGDKYRIHPKFFMFKNSAEFKCAHFTDYTPVEDSWLSRCREIAAEVYIESRMEADSGKGIKAGDQLSFHYEQALELISPESIVLDCACGPGYGSRMLARKASKVIAADIDLPTVRKAAAGRYYANITFQTGDATALDFPADSFDAVTSFETIEHLEADKYISEMFRVIKPGGMLILSTPQNSHGHIPVNSQHLREYSLDEIIGLCSAHFAVEKVIGIKQGRIIFQDDPIGQNTMLICRKRK